MRLKFFSRIFYVKFSERKKLRFFFLYFPQLKKLHNFNPVKINNLNQ